MNTTKVRMSPYLLDYLEGIAERANQAREKKLIVAARSEIDPEIEPLQIELPVVGDNGLLPPPQIESVCPDLCRRNGAPNGLIQIHTADVFGIAALYVSLRDETGRQLERGYAMRNEICEHHWGYFPSVDLAAGTTVIVRVVVMDTLGGQSVAEETCTVYDLPPR